MGPGRRGHVQGSSFFLYPSPGWKPAQSCLNFLKKFVLFCQEWHHHKDEDILTYRDKSFASKFTGESSFTANIRTLSLCRHPVHCPSLCVFVSFLMFVCLPINIYDSSLFAGTQSSVHHIVCLFLCLFLFVCLFVCWLISNNSSCFAGTQSPVHHTNFMYALDDSLDTFMHQTKKWNTRQFNERKPLETTQYQTKAWNLEHANCMTIWKKKILQKKSLFCIRIQLSYFAHTFLCDADWNYMKTVKKTTL